jgi:hypothetical protein
MFATDWFLVLYATALPAETAARVWDAVFCEGAKALHRVALALLARHEAALLKRDNAGACVGGRRRRGGGGLMGAYVLA